MKYEIENMKKNEIIEKIEFKTFKGNSIIVVTYLDKSVEHYEKSEENLLVLKEKMEQQAYNYTNEFESKLKNLENKNLKEIIFSLIILTGIILLVSVTKQIALFYLLSTIFSISLIGAITVNFNNYSKITDLKKYKLYLDNKDLIEKEYKNYIDEQRRLGNYKRKNYTDITNIDKISYEKLQNNMEEVNRNNEIKLKVKTLTK